MIVRSSRLVLQLVAATFVGFALVTVVAVWGLSRGPVELGFLTDMIEDSVSAEMAPSRVRLERTVLAWSAARRSIDLTALGVTVIDGSGRTVARVPEADLGLSAVALLRGLVAPSRLEIRGARLRLIRSEAGGVAMMPGGNGSEEDVAPAEGEARRDLLQAFLEGLLAPPDPGSASGYLHSVVFTDIDLNVIDRRSGLRWAARDASIRLERDADGIRADMAFDVDAGRRAGRVELAAFRSSSSEMLELSLDLQGLQPAVLARIEPALGELERLSMLVDGTLLMTIDTDLSIRSVLYRLNAAGGTLDIPELYETPLDVTGVTAAGRYDVESGEFELDEGRVDLGEAGSGSVQARAVPDGEGLAIELSAEARDVPVDALRELWPVGLAEDARRWVTSNLENGTAQQARVRVLGRAPLVAPMELAVTELGGDLTFSGVTVHYFRPMSPVVGAAGRASFDLARFLIEIDQGHAGELSVEAAEIDILGLDVSDQVAQIELTVSGPTREALALISGEPLRLADRMGLDAAATDGLQRTNLLLHIPLENDLDTDDIGVAAAASLVDFSQTSGPFGMPVDGGNLTLEVDRTAITARGQANIDGIPVDAVWTEHFLADAPFDTRYELRAVVDENIAADLGLSLPDGLLKGAVGLSLVYTEFAGGEASGAADLDLASALIDVGAIGLTKPAGVPARGRIQFAIRDGELDRITNYSLVSEDIELAGTADFARSDDGAELRRVVFDRLAYGETDVSGEISIAEGGAVGVRLAGRALDLREIVADAASLQKQSSDPPAESGQVSVAPAGGAPSELTLDVPITLTVADDRPLGIVRIGESTSLLGVTGRLEHDGDAFRIVDFRGGLGPSGELVVRLDEHEVGREFTVAAADAGAFIAALGITEAIREGRLVIEGRIHDREEGRPIVGQAIVENFKVQEAPVMARILTLASFQGIADTMSGDGIFFDRLQVPFSVTDTEVELKDVRARGSQLGILADGTIDRTANVIALKGEVAPVRTLNGLLGKIPILGEVLTGGGEGIFAATYRVDGPLDDPDVSVNPLTVLAPGFLRRIFTGFGDPEENNPNNNGPLFPEEDHFD